MGFIGGVVADRMLERFSPQGGPDIAMANYVRGDPLETLLGDDIFERVHGRSVLDYGCANGSDAITLARGGAREVIGLDIVEASLQRARAEATRVGLGDRCRFVSTWERPVDVIVSVDAFEHFDDPAAVLDSMAGMLAVDGCAIISFGPTWWHPLGGHIFSVFPWAHVLFTERALLHWRARFRNDGATRFGDVEGGLNQMTIAHFERLVSASPLRMERLELIPIKRLRALHGRWSREFATAMVRAELRLRH